VTFVGATSNGLLYVVVDGLQHALRRERTCGHKVDVTLEENPARLALRVTVFHHANGDVRTLADTLVTTLVTERSMLSEDSASVGWRIVQAAAKVFFEYHYPACCWEEV
jgi:hypothetical protein